MTAALPITSRAVAAVLARHLPVYRCRTPAYQTVMLEALASLWRGRPARLLDIGGGTGVIGQCISDLLPVGSVTAIDIADRFCPGLTIATRVYDGQELPFAAGSFDAATLNNVLHHVPPAIRVALLREIGRVVDGPLYIKDHEARGWIDHRRLTMLDAIGNIPFGGMVRATYLGPADWAALARATGYRIAETIDGAYRHGAWAAAFPNRLEIAMRWERG